MYAGFAVRCAALGAHQGLPDLSFLPSFPASFVACMHAGVWVHNIHLLSWNRPGPGGGIAALAASRLEQKPLSSFLPPQVPMPRDKKSPGIHLHESKKTPANFSLEHNNSFQRQNYVWRVCSATQTSPKTSFGAKHKKTIWDKIFFEACIPTFFVI